MNIANRCHFMVVMFIFLIVIEHLSSIPIVIAAQEALILAAQRLSNYISTSSNSWHFVHDCWLRWIRYCLDVLQTRRKKMWFDQCCDTTPSKRFDHGKPSSYQCSNVVMCFKMLKYLTIDVTKSNNFVELLQRYVLYGREINDV